MASDRMDFVRKYLSKKPSAEFAEVKAAAAKKGYDVPPVVFGKAKDLLGLAKPKRKKKAGKKKASRKKATRKASGRRGSGSLGSGLVRKRGPGRPRKQVSATDTLDGLVAAMRALEEERDAYKAALEEISSILRSL